MLNELDRSTPKSLPWRVEEAYAAEVELERARWKAVTAFVVLLSDDERLAPGYYSDPNWSVKGLVAHLGAWISEARVRLLEAWFGRREPDEAANQWIRKTGAEHYGEHLSRLRDWVGEVIDLRTRPVVDEWEG